jgi:small subunit ribosomal protein S21
MISVPSVRDEAFFEAAIFQGRDSKSRQASGDRLRNSGAVGRCYTLAEVKLQEGETLENALRRFKRKVQQEDIIKEVKRHSFYLKPGEKRRAKQALARKRNRKKSRREIE